MNLEEVFSSLYDRRDRLTDLIAINKETLLEKRRVKRSLERSTFRGLVETSWQDGHVYYLASSQEREMRNLAFSLSIIRNNDRISVASRPLRDQGRPYGYDQLLIIFCVTAVGVIAAGIVFLIVL